MRSSIRVLCSLPVALLAPLLAGCSGDGGFFPGTLNHNEGAVDYRVAPISIDYKDADPWKPAPRIALSEAGLPYHVDSRSIRPKSFKRGNEEVQSVRLSLKQAYLRNYAESDPVGEIAVIVNVKESRTGLTGQDVKAGRVVYYTEGARKNAFLNFRDQPVYGPVRYNGGDIQLRLSILELDAKDNSVATSVLKTLATLGSIAYPPSSPVLGALEKVGESVIALNGDDLEWDYAMRFSSRPVSERVGERTLDAWLMDGYFIFVRSDVTNAPERARITDHEWAGLEFDPNTAMLYKRGADGKTLVEFTDRSWLVIAVQTGMDSNQLDTEEEIAQLDAVVKAYGDGQNGLAKAADQIATSLTETIKSLRANKAESKMMIKNTTDQRDPGTPPSP